MNKMAQVTNAITKQKLSRTIKQKPLAKHKINRKPKALKGR